jgi:hypothetical protein
MDACVGRERYTVNELLERFDAQAAFITQSEGLSKTKLPASPDAGGGPKIQPGPIAAPDEAELRDVLHYMWGEYCETIGFPEGAKFHHEEINFILGRVAVNFALAAISPVKNTVRLFSNNVVETASSSHVRRAKGNSMPDRSKAEVPDLGKLPADYVNDDAIIEAKRVQVPRQVPRRL